MPSKKVRVARRARGLCGGCGARPPELGFKLCLPCLECCRIATKRARSDGRKAAWQYKYKVSGRSADWSARYRRTPLGWAVSTARHHIRRAKAHNNRHPDFKLTLDIIDGPKLLEAVLSHGPICGLCGIHTGYPWETVGKETGPEVDHILSVWAIVRDGRSDWTSVSNIRLLCISCHKEEGIRLKRQDIEEYAHMERMLAKDNS